jgi:alkylation response protein AidB-like acyl-CoA dehydrogenase
MQPLRGEPIANFPRVADKIAMMAVEIMMARHHLLCGTA